MDVAAIRETLYKGYKKLFPLLGDYSDHTIYNEFLLLGIYLKKKDEDLWNTYLVGDLTDWVITPNREDSLLIQNIRSCLLNIKSQILTRLDLTIVEEEEFELYNQLDKIDNILTLENEEILRKYHEGV